MKTVLANVSNSFFVRNFLRTEALKVLEEDGRVRLVLLAPKTKLSYYRSEFPQAFVVFDALPEVRKSRIERLFKFLETASIHSRTSLLLSKGQLHRLGDRRPFLLRYAIFLGRYLLWQVGRFELWRNFLRKSYALFSNPAFEALLEKYKPDLVFLPTMIYPEDYVLAKAAKKRKIRTLGMTLSWDNFYSKTFLLVLPESLMVHTTPIVQQAAKFADYTEERITVTGIPQYDRYFRKREVMGREEFFKKIGGDASQKLILYALSGKAGLNIEFEILEVLHEAFRSGRIKASAEVLVRPYPRYDFPAERLEEVRRRYGFLTKQAVSHPIQKGDWEFDDAALRFLEASLKHADLVITMYSTFFIEAAIFDKPLIGIAFDGRKNLDYWNSSRRFFDWNHLAELRPLDGIWLVRNAAEFVGAINKYFENPKHFEEGRKRIVRLECEFEDGRSGVRVAKTILQVLGLN